MCAYNVQKFVAKNVPNTWMNLWGLQMVAGSVPINRN